jgi:hypothetical protein
MSEREIILALIQMVPIIAIWVRLESRLSRLEGRFDMFMKFATSCLEAFQKRPGSKQED